MTKQTKNIWPQRPGETQMDDISGLRLRIPNPSRAQVSRAEAINIRKAEKKYFHGNITKKKAAFDLPWLKKLHAEMFSDVWGWAGTFRTTDKNIGADKRQIQMQLIQLLQDLHAWPEMNVPPLEQAVRLHHRAAFIHPFENGNGRWARMLCNIWLRRQKAGVILWPVTEDTVSPVREEYLNALRAADDMDEKPLMELHRRYWQPPA